ncbi:MAG: LCP family protein [Clostridia bacterium]|nr:LCP family protein [Clostridia bacterium]
MLKRTLLERFACALVVLALAVGCMLPAATAEVFAPANPMMPTAAPLPTQTPTAAPLAASTPTAAPVPTAEPQPEQTATQEPEQEHEQPVEEIVVPADPVLTEQGRTDDEAQDWYDQIFAEVAQHVPQPGVVVDGALLVQGQEMLSETEAEVLLTLEEAQLHETDVIDSSGKINILLLGVDARPGQKTGRSDAMILCSVDLETNTIKMISFMRDMYVQIPDHNPNRLNTAYYWGGPELLYKTLKANFGVTADHYVAVDFSVLGSLIDQLGGLEINVEDSYFVDRINAVIENDNEVLGINIHDGKLKEPGLQTLTGKQAQAYARFRYGAKSGGDYARTGRQREVLMKIFDKVTQLSAAEMASLAMNNIDAVATDLTLIDLVKLAPVALQLKDATFEELRVPADGYFSNKTIKGMAVLLPEYERINKQIREFLK